jgi:hypothetical protein
VGLRGIKIGAGIRLGWISVHGVIGV